MLNVLAGLLNAGRAEEVYPLHRSSSQNFIVRSFAGGPAASEVLIRCDSLRQELGRVWYGSDSIPRWEPCCEIRLYPSEHQYVQAVGLAGAQTLGSSLIQLNADHSTLVRRIDLLIDRSGDLPALPHELTHMVLADRFGGRQPPMWLDEGAAILADTGHKQSLHERDCRLALQHGEAMLLSDLLRLERFTSARQMPSFYGQSASLMRFLYARGGSDKVTQFGLDAMRQGYDQALRDHYGIHDVAELEQQWRCFAYTQSSTAPTARVFGSGSRP